MAARNADSMTNAQGEFMPHKPRDEPIETKGHQVGQKVSPADHAPEFSAKTLPPGTAPANATYQPNPTSEVPGQAFNDNVDRSHGKEGVRTDPLSTLPGATSADVHTGLGHPGQGQTSTEIRHEGHHTRKKHTSGPEGAGASGGSGLQDPTDVNTEFRRLQQEGDHPRGPLAGHNVRKEGAEAKEPVSAEFLAAEGAKPGEYAKYSKSKGATTGVPDRGAGNARE
ncbi:uncharacterized protein Z520_03303 [Fonsecaea multimorphosa CBS 102226]|uniref:Uncharacterized protein n=1 Tax=Fonsecaea multimorphosa CBS 102226 TaxID=1442371 RepID=A0A0D2KC14_9EURO|nr:uncharacterized protein Z520_03303 [Fonsecaea multimorphosa CBS 102226]KIY00640.1 hypothetical protein Z520_03303 [Fonsecaea multimorphosa CBS 102226]OAL19029.1 hypothetical protein AYO22_10358 [Fonsecaea multimorphosa]